MNGTQLSVCQGILAAAPKINIRDKVQETRDIMCGAARMKIEVGVDSRLFMSYARVGTYVSGGNYR